MTIIGILCLGASLGSLSICFVLYLMENAPIDVGPRKSVIPRTNVDLKV